MAQRNTFYKDTAIIYQNYTHTPEYALIENLNNGEALESLIKLMKRAVFRAWKINPNNFTDDELIELSRSGINCLIDFENDSKYKLESEVELKDIETIKAVVRF